MPGSQTAQPRRCLPLVAWPGTDRTCWAAATRQGDLLLDDGPAAHLRPGSLDKHADGYGRWLAWLDEQGWLEAEDGPAARVTPERVTSYITALGQLNAPRTVLNRVTDLVTVLGWLAPERDWSWLRRVLARLHARVRPVRDKRARLRSAHELLALGKELMQAAETGDPPALSWRERARNYRDGLMIALLALRPLRLANFARLELGRDLVDHGGAGWWLEIPGIRTKTGQPIELPFPTELLPALEAYLATWRPRLARPEYLICNPALWPTQRGTTSSDIHLYNIVVARTRKAFGQPVNPHLFRDAAATTIALDSPEQVRLAGPLLGHRSFATTERYYNLARAAEAASAWHAVLKGMTQPD